MSIEEKLQWKFVLLWSILTMLRKVVGRNSEGRVILHVSLII